MRVLWLCLLLACVECTHIFTLDEDFSKLKTDPALEKHVIFLKNRKKLLRSGLKVVVEQVLKKLKTFKVAVHPRIRLFYLLLKSGMADHAHRTADTLYTPYVYKEKKNNLYK